MKKFQKLGVPLSKEEQKKIMGGFFSVYNTFCRCYSGPPTSLCGSSCGDVNGQCFNYCANNNGVLSYGTCTQDPACL